MVNRDFVDSKQHLIAQSLASSVAERHANARLIAAAPDLLAALRGLLSEVSARADDLDILEAVLAAEAAVDKATGGDL